MSPEQWKKVKSIFNEASELPNGEIAPLLVNYDDQIRLEVEKMLAAVEEQNLLLNTPIIDFSDFVEAELPDKIGDYKIVREVGHGGMGTVFEAVRETENFKQRVALKVIKRGMNNEIILRRFRSEQQILATLEHQNIGRFLDGGKTAEGSPFYAMEFIEGVAIDEFCRENNLPVEAKVKIFREVCSAVSYAHTNLIVHRDLKPSNIIVTKNGTPKLLDFGIAKVLDVDSKEVGTATQLGMMTPQYASPEQIRGEKVTTLSDVYSLGIIFYEILTGEKPYQLENKNYAEILEVITQAEPLKPSTNQKSKIINQKLKGDLDTIILKSLQKSPARRYQSVEQFSEDLRRHLAGLPISARPDTFQYRFSKFVGRNRVGVAAGVLVFLSLLGGIGVASWQAYRAEKQRLLAEKRFTEVRTIANNLVFKYTDQISTLPNSMQIREQLLQDGSNYLDRLAEDSGGDFLLQKELAAAYIKLGNIKGEPHTNSLGDTSGAIESYEKAIALLENIYQSAKTEEKVSSALALISVYRQISTTFSRANVAADRRKNNSNKIQTIIEEMSRNFPDNLEFKIESATLNLSETKHLLIKNFDEGEILFEQTILPTVIKIEKNTDVSSQNFASKVYDDLMWIFWERAKLLIQIEPNSERAKMIFTRAYEFALRSEKFKENEVAQNPDDVQNKRSLMVGYVNVGISLYYLERFDESLNYLNKGDALVQEISAFDSNNIQAVFDGGTIASEFGIFHDKKKDYQTALKFYEKSIVAFENVISKDSKHHEAIYYQIEVLLQTAATYFKIGNFTKSLEYCKQADDLWQKHYSAGNDDQNQLGRIYLERGKTFAKLAVNNPNYLQTAKSELQTAREIMQKDEVDNHRLFVQIIERELEKIKTDAS